jgi:hypothetical protein
MDLITQSVFIYKITHVHFPINAIIILLEVCVALGDRSKTMGELLVRFTAGVSLNEWCLSIWDVLWYFGPASRGSIFLSKMERYADQ